MSDGAYGSSLGFTRVGQVYEEGSFGEVFFHVEYFAQFEFDIS